MKKFRGDPGPRANYRGKEMDITSVAARFYSTLYRFAVSLTRSDNNAADLEVRATGGFQRGFV
jgi:hypothetical protein